MNDNQDRRKVMFSITGNRKQVHAIGVTLLFFAAAVAKFAPQMAMTLAKWGEWLIKLVGG